MKAAIFEKAGQPLVIDDVDTTLRLVRKHRELDPPPALEPPIHTAVTPSSGSRFVPS